jgi:tRNA(Ile2) C34 agmatinyltransferase TiaS
VCKNGTDLQIKPMHKEYSETIILFIRHGLNLNHMLLNVDRFVISFMNDIRKQTRVFKCPQKGCVFKALERFSISQHQKTHEEKPNCEQCGERMLKRSLARHASNCKKPKA